MNWPAIIGWGAVIFVVVSATLCVVFAYIGVFTQNDVYGQAAMVAGTSASVVGIFMFFGFILWDDMR